MFKLKTNFFVSQIRVANAFKRAGHERHRRLSLLAEASSNSFKSNPSDASPAHWWTKKSSESDIKLKGMKPASQPLLEEEDDTNV